MYTKSKTFIADFLISTLVFLFLSISVPVKAAAESQGVWYVNTSQKVIALTFDDCLDGGNLQLIINILNANNVKGTFYPIGAYADTFKTQLQYALSTGHEIGTHTYSHADLTLLTYSQIMDELTSSASAIKAATGQLPTTFRPPFLSYNSTVFQAAADAGYSRTIIASVDPSDWDDTVTAAQVRDNVLNTSFPGSIVLLHANSNNNTPEALQEIITGLKNKGYTFVTISQLLTYGPIVGPNSTVQPVTAVRYGGADRFQTAVQVSQAGWSTYDNVVLANGENFADALVGVPFAYRLGAPILLTYQNALPSATSNEISRLKAKSIYILGGTGAVSASVENTLRSQGYNVYRYAGSDRFGTAAAAADLVMSSSASKTAVIATAYNYPDALSISPYAAISRYPILYTEPDSLNSVTKNYLLQNGITKIIIPGMYGAVSLNVENALKNLGITVQRVGGDDRYLTSYAIVNTFQSSFGNNVMIASGENFPDALSGAALAAKLDIPVLLVGYDSIISESSLYIKSKGSMTLYVVGGTGVISDNLLNQFK